MYGKTEGGAMIMVVLELLRRQTFRPVTARAMMAAEKRSYKKKSGG